MFPWLNGFFILVTIVKRHFLEDIIELENQITSTKYVLNLY